MSVFNFYFLFMYLFNNYLLLVMLGRYSSSLSGTLGPRKKNGQHSKISVEIRSGTRDWESRGEAPNKP